MRTKSGKSIDSENFSFWKCASHYIIKSSSYYSVAFYGKLFDNQIIMENDGYMERC